MKMKKMSLYKQFAYVFIVIIFIPIFVVGSISYLNSKKSIENMVYKLLKQDVEKINSKFDSMYDDISSFSLKLVTSSIVRNFVDLNERDFYEKYDFYNWSNQNMNFDQLIQRIPVITNITIISDSGARFSYDNTKGYDPNINYSVSEYLMDENTNNIKKIPKDGGLEVFGYKVKTSNVAPSKQIICFARRIYSAISYKTTGTVYINIIADTMNKVWEDTSGNNEYIWVGNKEGQIIYHKDFEKIGQTVEDVFFEGLKQEDKINKIAATDEYVINNKSKNTGWIVGATIPSSMMNEPVENLRNVIIFVSLFIFPITMMAGYILIKSITRPLRVLQLHMKEASMENWVPVKNITVNNEIDDLIITYNKMIKKIEGLIEEVYKSELSNKQHELEVQKAEFQALQMQINPHFLYNTLGTINAYAMIFKDNSIQEMIQALGSMFRYAVQNPIETVKLSDEIEHVKNYLVIQKYRQDVMPSIYWNIEEALYNHSALRLTLQPIVENVFNHAFFQGIETDSFIKISASIENNCFLLVVEDNGMGFEKCNEMSSQGTGIGIRNIDRRIKIAFGDEYGVSLSEGSYKGAVVILKYPLLEKTITFKQTVTQ
jgi:two-component system sensor histidine kinase YesM